MKRDYSPEERLLKLIRNSGKKDVPKGGGEARGDYSEDTAGADSALPQNTRNKAPVGGLKARSASHMSPFKLREISTKSVNPLLIVTLAALVLYFAIDLVYGQYYKKEVNLLAERGEGSVEAKVKTAKSAEPYTYYSSQVDERNIFSPQESEAAVVQTGPTVEEISSNLSLIGIIAGEKPQAIIEEKKAGKSYFIYKGGVVGQSKVVDILEDKVTMEYKGQSFELVL